MANSPVLAANITVPGTETVHLAWNIPHQTENTISCKDHP